MALDNVQNFARTSLSEDLTSSETDVDINDASQLPDPANGEYNIVVWDDQSHPNPANDTDAEIMRVTAESSGTLTVTRGQENTSGTSHSSGYAVANLLTAKMINDIDTGLGNKFDTAGTALSASGTTINLSASLTDLSDVGTTSATDGHVIASDGTDFDSEDIATVTENHVNLADLKDVDTTVSNSQLTNSSVAVAGNSVRLGGSTSVSVNDLSDVASSTESAGEIPIWHGTNSQYENNTLTGGTNVSITNNDGSITIDATDTDTTYSAGDGLTLSGTTFNTRLDIDDGGSNVTTAYGIDFGSNLSVSDDGDNTVTVSASTSGTDVAGKPFRKGTEEISVLTQIKNTHNQ